MNNPYQQQMYNSYIPQYVNNPYLQQRYYQQPQTDPQGISGRVVQTAESINANDVPMDGSKAFFPKQDLSEIYVKGWNADGTIKTIVYKPYTEPKINQEVNSTTNAENFEIRLSEKATEDIMDKFNELFDKIEELEAKMQRKSSRTQSKESE